MKYFCLLFMLLLNNIVYSQSYLEIQFGNSFPVFRNMSFPMHTGYYIENADTNIKESNVTNINLGDGISGGFIFGKMTKNKKISLALSGFYSNSNTGFLKNKTIYEYYYITTATTVVYQTWESTFKGQKIMITPKINYYMSFGKVINSVGIGATFNLIYINEIYNFKSIFPGYSNTTVERYKYTTKNELGYSFLLEDKFLFQISDNLFFNTTISFQPLRIKTNKGKRYYQKTILVTDNSYSEKENNQIVEGNQSYFLNFSVINLSFGLRYSFGKKEKTNKYI